MHLFLRKPFCVSDIILGKTIFSRFAITVDAILLSTQIKKIGRQFFLNKIVSY